jgi:hypothetical protein
MLLGLLIEAGADEGQKLLFYQNSYHKNFT